MDDINKIIYELEASLLKPEIRSSSKILNKLLADDFIEFGSSGFIYDKKNVLERLPNATTKTEYKMSDFVAKILSDNIVLTTFKIEKIINKKDKITSLRSSLWKKVGDDWQIFFHQGTITK